MKNRAKNSQMEQFSMIVPLNGQVILGWLLAVNLTKTYDRGNTELSTLHMAIIYSLSYCDDIMAIDL